MTRQTVCSFSELVFIIMKMKERARSELFEGPPIDLEALSNDSGKIPPMNSEQSVKLDPLNNGGLSTYSTLQSEEFQSLNTPLPALTSLKSNLGY